MPDGWTSRVKVSYRRVQPQTQSNRLRKLGAVWTTYAIIDSKKQIRYIGYTGLPLFVRIANHISAARTSSVRSRWNEWLLGEVVAQRSVSIREIEAFRDESGAQAAELETIAGLLARGVPLLNTRTHPRPRCIKCGAASVWIASHKCKRRGKVRVAYRVVMYPPDGTDTTTRRDEQ